MFYIFLRLVVLGQAFLQIFFVSILNEDVYQKLMYISKDNKKWTKRLLTQAIGLGLSWYEIGKKHAIYQKLTILHRKRISMLTGLKASPLACKCLFYKP